MSHLDEHGNPILYDVTAFHTLEGVLGAPAGTWLTKANGRRFQVTTDLPLDPAYQQEHTRLTRLQAQAAKARTSRTAHE